MNNSTAAIKEYLSQAQEGSLFSINELVNYASYDTAKNILQRMEKNGEIVRVIDGIYSKPKFSKLLNKNVPSSIPDVANKIAEKFAWNIIPSGDIALNMLHLSTQVPACYEYLSKKLLYSLKYFLNILKSCTSCFQKIPTINENINT